MKRGRGSREIATPRTEQAEPLLAWCGSTDPAWRTLLEAIPESLAPNIELLRCNDVSDWIAQCEPAKNIQLLVGLEHRNDHHALELLKQLAAPPTPKTTPQTASNAHRKKSSTTSRSKPKPNQSLAIAAVLGEDWQGHRRTFPLPDSLETFYWYQWFDGVLPWIQSRDLLPANNQQLSPRVGRIIDRSEQAKSILRAHMQQPSMQQPSMQLAAMPEPRTCWVLSDEPKSVALWQSLLEQYGVRTIGSLIDDAWPTLQTDCIFYAPESRSAQAPVSVEPNPRIVNDLRSLRDEHTTSFIVLFHPFLRWNDWPTFHKSGADAIACPPCSLEGILTTCFLHR
jgi:hypothetical protein